METPAGGDPDPHFDSEPHMQPSHSLTSASLDPAQRTDRTGCRVAALWLGCMELACGTAGRLWRVSAYRPRRSALIFQSVGLDLVLFPQLLSWPSD